VIELSLMQSYRRFLTAPFGSRGYLMFSRLSFVMPLSKLLLNFFGHNIDCRVKIGFDIFREQVGPRKGNAHRAAKLALGRFGLIVLESRANIRRVLVQMIQFIDSADEMIFDGFCQRQVVSRKNQVHVVRMHQSQIKSSETVRWRLG